MYPKEKWVRIFAVTANALLVAPSGFRKIKVADYLV